MTETIDLLERECYRLMDRRDELAERKTRNEAARAQFVDRINGDIRAALDALTDEAMKG